MGHWTGKRGDWRSSMGASLLDHKLTKSSTSGDAAVFSPPSCFKAQHELLLLRHFFRGRPLRFGFAALATTPPRLLAGRPGLGPVGLPRSAAITAWGSPSRGHYPAESEGAPGSRGRKEL